MTRMHRFPILLALGLALGLLAGCEQKGPAEKAGEKIDKAVGDTGKAMEKAGDKIGEAAKDAEKKVKEATK